jgi:hypothetical protein
VNAELSRRLGDALATPLGWLMPLELRAAFATRVFALDPDSLSDLSSEDQSLVHDLEASNPSHADTYHHPTGSEHDAATSFPAVESNSLVGSVLARLLARRFNPNHDPSNGEFSSGGDSGGGPPSLPFEAPPLPKGVNAGTLGTGGFAANGETVTSLGDLAENMSSKLGFNTEHPDERQGAFDLRWDHSDDVFELKARLVDSTEYKAGIRADDLAGKFDTAAANGDTPHLMIAVLDPQAGAAQFYWHDELGSKTLSPNTYDQWHYAGKVDY